MLTYPDFSACKVVVIGDAMLDRYWYGDTSRISPEAPVPVVKIARNEERVGGAANVAVNVRALGVNTSLMSVIGEDDAGATLLTMLQAKNIQCDFIKLNNLRTTLKLRVLGRHQQLLRCDFEDKHSVDTAQILSILPSTIKQANVIILSDYAKGVLQDPQPIIAFARAQGIPVLVDPKNADLSVYRGANILTPNLGEFEAAVGPCKNITEIEIKGLQLVLDLKLDGLLVTRGSQGMTLIQKNKAPLHISANAREVFDITGAGDTVIAVLGAALARGIALEQAAQWANVAAGIVVGKLGTATISKEELQAALTLSEVTSSAHHRGILTVAPLLTEVARHKMAGKKIVLTNGCFDILHAGHVTYLQQARALGDCLIIAVNSDDSVRRLKGLTRPINSLMERMQVLTALGCVDYVVAFSEDTPEKLITQILPHILVKGGDYTPEQIAGANAVMQHGGRVEILPFVPGCSTTGMLERANQLQEELA